MARTLQCLSKAGRWLLLAGMPMAVLAAPSPALVPGLAPLPGTLTSALSQKSGTHAELRIMTRRIELPAIRLEEIADGPNLSAGSIKVSAMGQPGGLQARLETPLLPLHPSVRRELTGLWQLSLPRGAVTSGVHVQIDVESAAGERGMLRQGDALGAILPVRVISTPAYAAYRTQDLTILQGDAILEIPTKNMVRAGSYSGHMVITLEGT